MASAIEAITTLLALAGLSYMLLALWGARDYTRTLRRRATEPEYTPGVTLPKPP